MTQISQIKITKRRDLSRPSLNPRHLRILPRLLRVFLCAFRVLCGELLLLFFFAIFALSRLSPRNKKPTSNERGF